MNDRRKKIFKVVIKEHVDSARPVGSKEICKKYKLGVSPATVRHELAALEEEGFLSQPHTSAGRIPTPKGYRFFIDEVLNDDVLLGRAVAAIEKSIARFEEDVFSSMAQLLSDETGMLGMAGSLDANLLRTRGLRRLFGQPDFSSGEDFREVGEILERVERDFFAMAENMFRGNDETVRTFVGAENPFCKTDRFSFIMAPCRPKKQKSMMLIMGPTRMRYQKNIGFMRGLRDLMNDSL